jgi:thioredoxin 1
MKFFIAIFLLVFALEGMAEEPRLQETEYKYVQQSIGKGKPYFLEVGSDSCYSCQVMGAALFKIKQKRPEYNIHFINAQKERKVARKLEIRMIPTQIIYDESGKEAYRHIGILSNEELAVLFKTHRF